MKGGNLKRCTITRHALAWSLPDKSLPDKSLLVKALLASLLLVTASGCGSDLGTSYGASKGMTAERSVNGFSALRDGFVAAGFEQRDLYRLTNRARRTSVIVWTPTHPGGIESKTTRWMERWLQSGHRTLVYVLPDSGSETEFYRQARSLASPEQRLEYRRKYAEGLLDEHGWQLQRTAYPSNGWFAAIPQVQRSDVAITKASAPTWRPVFRTTASGTPEPTSDARPRRFEWVIQEYDDQDSTLNAPPNYQPLGPGQASWSYGETVTRSDTKVSFEPLLNTENDDAVVARITSKSWKTSQVIVVGGGSLLTNFGLTHRSNQHLANNLIRISQDLLIDDAGLDPDLHLFADGTAPLVGFTNATSGLPISERVTDIPRAAGAELLTVFPISFVTIHIALLGFVICMALLPTFGRPRKVVYHALTNFGDHLDAVANLMRRRGGESYARRKISEYMKRVRGETHGPWVIQDTTKEIQPAKPIVPVTVATDDNPSEPFEANR